MWRSEEGERSLRRQVKSSAESLWLTFRYSTKSDQRSEKQVREESAGARESERRCWEPRQGFNAGLTELGAKENKVSLRVKTRAAVVIKLSPHAWLSYLIIPSFPRACRHHYCPAPQGHRNFRHQKPTSLTYKHRGEGSHSSYMQFKLVCIKNPLCVLIDDADFAF